MRTSLGWNACASTGSRKRLEKWANVLDHIDGRLGALRAIVADVARASDEQQIYATTQVQIMIDLDPETVVEEFDQARGIAPAAFADAVDADATESRPAEPEPEDPLQRDDRLVEALLHDVLSRPLPDEHPAAALWSRLSSFTTAAALGDSATQQLVGAGFELEHAAQIMATNTWPGIVDQVRTDLREGRQGTLTAALSADDDTPYESVDEYAGAILTRLSGQADSGESPEVTDRNTALDRLRSTRAQTKARLAAEREEREKQQPRRDEPRPDDPGQTPRL